MKFKRGFSLIEVLVFVTILSLFFISAVTITVFSIRSLKIQEHKIIATRYVEEALEWVKQEKEDDWQIFSSHDDSVGGAGTKFCFNVNPIDWSDKSDCGSSYNLGQPIGIYNRVLTITNSGSPVDQITANLTVSWLENGVVQSVVLKSVFNLWE